MRYKQKSERIHNNIWSFRPTRKTCFGYGLFGVEQYPAKQIGHR